VRTAAALAMWKGLRREDLRRILANMTVEEALSTVERELPAGAPPEKELDRSVQLANDHCIRYEVYAGELYPAMLAAAPDAPAILFYRGSLEILMSIPAIAVIGSRRCTQYGRRVAASLSRDMAAAGVAIVSGLARGIDSEAHRGALQAEGTTVAVMGHGLDICYPPEHAGLAAEIEQKGVLLSEYPPGTPPAKFRFPERNRIISGLSRGVVVVEAGRESGTMITVGTALDQGREVFAVPGEITRALSMGTNMLLRDGAGAVITADDVLNPLGIKRPDRVDGEPTRIPGGETASRIVELLSEGEKHFDRLIRECGVDGGELRRELLRLEIAGLIEKRPGGIYFLV